MNFGKHNRNEKGQVFLLSLIVLAVGFFTVTSLLGLMATSVKAIATYQNKMKQSYAGDAGIEDAAQKMITNYPAVENLGDGQTFAYTIPSINGMPVTVTIKKLSLLDGLLGDDEYKVGQPHEGWVQFQIPTNQIVRNYQENYVEYTCTLDFTYDGSGNRRIESVGVFFAPFPGDPDLIQGPYDATAVPVMTFANLESVEKKVVTGGFAFIWRWLSTQGPQFSTQDRTGSISAKFRVNDANWEHTSAFVWATFQEQDVSYWTNSQLNKWLVSAIAGQTNTKVQAIEDEGSGSVVILTWERN